MKTFINLLICLLFSISVLAQKQSSNGKISGKIVDSSKETLPYATVVLKDASKQILEGVVTDEEGLFTFSKILIGDYNLEIQYIGFETIERKIKITKEQRIVSLGSIILKENTKTLDEIVVKAETSEVSLKLGKKVFRVGKDITSQSGSATDVLSNVPSVNVSPTGTVSLRGNANVQVMINGRRSALTQSQALEQLSADVIESIEVITNPSAKYDASGSAGIINIILKKNRKTGLNGQVRLVSGVPDDFRAIGNLNYKANKFNFFTNIGIRYTDYEGEYFKQQTTTENNITTFLNQREDEDRHDDGQLFYFGTDYYINDKNTITVAYYRNETEDTDVTNLFYDFSNSGVLSQSLQTIGNSKEERDYNQLEANYTKTFAKKGQKLTIDFQYDFWNSEKDWHLQTDEKFPTTSIAQTTIQTKGKGSTDDIVIQTDFKTPINKQSNFEIGAKFENRKITNEFLAEELINGQFEVIDNINNQLNYKEKIMSGYAQLNSKKGKISYQVGLRLENTSIDIQASETTLNLKNNYTNLFPSATLGYEFKENFSGQINYSKRISRPSLWQLNPFFQLKDFTSRFTGNPALNPSYTDAIELSLIYRGNKFRLNPSIYYSGTNDVFQYETKQNNEGIFIQSPINLDNEKRYGAELSASYNPLKWLRFSGDFNMYAFKQKGILNNKVADFSNNTWFTNFTMNIRPTKTIRLQTRIFHQGEESNAQTKTKPITNLNFGLQKSLFNNKGSLIFNIYNVLDTRRSREQITGDNFSIYQDRSRNAQRFSLSFVYKFNQKPSDKNRNAKRSNRN
ncbi:outer membrane beta-barrel family protein [uncultured Tenacibaculum sp.]|uniref:outer membrane beta-barrel family protein n=1 Tax=uncultured Tenacibaculum sp. TaxID=174713 RepID=UPI002627D52B|nr:outer membrane beta-barrel family protein [uncultured Tenacibaculum sp.]